jgi:hypothetical protein
MNALYQRLKDLDPKTFEDLCFQIIAARHPSAQIMRVDDLGGDQGMDFFQGNLVDGATVWQCKYFRNGIRSAQKTQIKKSLRVAVQHLQPKRWVLCVPIDLNASVHKWFQQLRQEYQKRVEVGLFQGSQIIRELIHRREIRNSFFPGAVLEPEELRSMLFMTGEYTDRELEKLSLENIQQYLQRLKNRDARFDYQVVFVPHEPTRASEVPLPGLIARVTDNDKQIDVFARDIEALRLDPPKLHFTVKGEAVKKVREALIHGKKVELGPTDLSDVRSSFDFLLSSKPDLSTQRLTIEPSPFVARPREFAFRIILGRGHSEVEYELVPFAVSKREVKDGRTRLELVSIDEGLPFLMFISFPVSDIGVPIEADIAFRARFTGKEVHKVLKFAKAMLVLKETGDIRVWDAIRRTLFFEAKMSFESFPAANKSFWELINDLCEIADAFKTTILFPESVDEEDAAVIALLLTLAREKEAGMEIKGISCTLTKSQEHERAFLESLGREMSFQFHVDRMSPLPRLFGTEIDTGPCLILVDRAMVSEKERVAREYANAKEGEGVVVAFDLLSPARVLRTSKAAAHLYARQNALDSNEFSRPTKGPAIKSTP